MGADARIRLSLDQIPVVNNAMPLMKLGAPVVVPDELVVPAIRAVAPRASLAPLGSRGARAAYDGRRLVAFIDPSIPELKVFPSLQGLKPGQRLSERAKAVAERLLHER